MRTVIASLLIAVLLTALGAGAVIYAGVYDIAATAPHWRVTTWLLETARIRSIKAQAAGITVPPGLEEPAKLVIGVEHYAAHCAVCHGAPGVPKGDIGRGLPPPPELAKTAPLYNPAELFWIVKHGIKMTGMPAWADHSDEELWATTVAFVEKLPGMSEQDYARLVMASMARGGGHH
jgi:mono/diheme cytochrome c family protein